MKNQQLLKGDLVVRIIRAQEKADHYRALSIHSTNSACGTFDDPKRTVYQHLAQTCQSEANVLWDEYWALKERQNT